MNNRVLGINNHTSRQRCLDPWEAAELRRLVTHVGYTVAEAAARFTVTPRTAYRYLKRGVTVTCRCGVSLPLDGRTLCHFCRRTEAMRAEVAA